MKCQTCNHENDVLGSHEREDGQKFVQLEFKEMSGYMVEVGRRGLNTTYFLFGCPKCGTVRFERRT